MPVFTRGEWFDLGNSVRARRVFRDGELEAIEYEHPCSRQKPDGVNPDYIPVRVGPPTGVASAAAWELNQAEPLTISPSLLCRACQHHGFIRDGQWVPA